jgi:hypothetical protein
MFLKSSFIFQDEYLHKNARVNLSSNGVGTLLNGLSLENRVDALKTLIEGKYVRNPLLGSLKKAGRDTKTEMVRMTTGIFKDYLEKMKDTVGGVKGCYLLLATVVGKAVKEAREISEVAPHAYPNLVKYVHFKQGKVEALKIEELWVRSDSFRNNSYKILCDI